MLQIPELCGLQSNLQKTDQKKENEDYLQLGEGSIPSAKNKI